jgi:hypothetical protein
MTTLLEVCNKILANDNENPVDNVLALNDHIEMIRDLAGMFGAIKRLPPVVPRNQDSVLEDLFRDNAVTCLWLLNLVGVVQRNEGLNGLAPTLVLDSRETSIVLSGLRLLQMNIRVHGPGIAGLEDEVDATIDEIDTLCEKINFGGD